MGKAAKSKREEMSEAVKGAGDEGYEFKLPKFDEQAFIRREVLSARASFYTLAVGLAAGVLSTLVYASPLDWRWGWLPIFGSMLALRPLLQAMKFPEDVTTWKALFGSFVMIFFTALSVWILGVNVVG